MTKTARLDVTRKEGYEETEGQMKVTQKSMAKRELDEGQWKGREGWRLGFGSHRFQTITGIDPR